MKLYQIYGLIIFVGTNVLFSNMSYAKATSPQKFVFKESGSVEDKNYLKSGSLEQKLMLVPNIINLNHKTYTLPASPATTQWGVYNRDQPPVLRIKSGDSVAIETNMAANNQTVPGVTAEEIAQMDNEVPGRGPHTLTGPIYVEEAQPGDVVRIKFNKIVPRSYAVNVSLPDRGLLPAKFPQGQVKYFYLDVKKMQMEFAPGIVLPLHPFPGTIAVSRDQAGRFNSVPPGKFGGNMDLPIMTEGSVLYLPVFVKGALIWTGDSHAGQGNGEINLTAIETAFSEFNITVDVIKHKHIEWPLIETPTSWAVVGYDADLNKALNLAIDNSVDFIMRNRKVSKPQAQKIAYSVWNCPIAEVVDEVNGIYCMIPKKLNPAKSPILPKMDTAKLYVTYARNNNVLQALKDASWAMINKIATQRKLTPLDAYSLASMAMDCSIAPYKSGEKEVHCMLPKNLWTMN
ncbi:MAG: acetamidase/formamidase family protein [Burkholderiales bacterium]|nr:acetamidase/formamidase family protein [Burkholderiales bacterium]